MGLFDTIFHNTKKQNEKQNENHDSEERTKKIVKDANERYREKHRNKRAEEVDKLVSQLRVSEEKKDFLEECYGNHSTDVKEKNEGEER